jgi:branched-chain amino acid transport system ATP-binding protein
MGDLLLLDGVRKRFGRVLVADGLRLAVGDGEVLGIVGPNGAGKSSLFGLIAGDLRPDAGEIAFDGRPVTALDAPTRARLGMGRTFQIPRPFEHMTVFENVLVAAHQGARLRGRAAQARAAGILDDTGLTALANQPAGRLTLLQRKRLELARALGTGPRLLLLDELSLGLAPVVVQRVYELLPEIVADGTTVLLVEQDVTQALRVADRVQCLLEGRTVLQGRPADLALPDVERAYFGLAERNTR